MLAICSQVTTEIGLQEMSSIRVRCSETEVPSRKSVPEDHPLAHLDPAAEIPQRASSLAQLHSRIKAGSAKATTFMIPRGHAEEGLSAVANPQGEPLTTTCRV